MAGSIKRECTKCKKILPLESFTKAKNGKYGRDSVCRDCKKVRMKEYRENPEVKERERLYHAELYKEPEYRKRQYLNTQTPERKMQKAVYQAEYRMMNKESIAASMREYCKDERVQRLRLEANRRYEHSHMEERADRGKTEEYKSRRRQWDKERRKEPKWNLSHRMSTRMNISLETGKQGRSWKDLVSYSINELIFHLESLFKSGMSWDNKGEWEVDHIRPVASFNFESPGDPDFKECWALENLQPLWAIDNIRKSDKWEVA